MICDLIIIFGHEMLQKQGYGYENFLRIQRLAKLAAGRSHPDYDNGVWYSARCDNPDCVDKTSDGKGKMGQSK